jgi:hypothetical protein
LRVKGERRRRRAAPSAEAIVLDLVHPVGAAWWLIGWGWKTGLNEAGGTRRWSMQRH